MRGHFTRVDRHYLQERSAHSDCLFRFEFHNKRKSGPRENPWRTYNQTLYA